jgi:hypothetical protein
MVAAKYRVSHIAVNTGQKKDRTIGCSARNQGAPYVVCQVSLTITNAIYRDVAADQRNSFRLCRRRCGFSSVHSKL